MHLDLAQNMMGRPELEPDTAIFIRRNWGAFCLGQIAADFQILCDVPRRTTHFYETPPEPSDYEAFERMLAQNRQMTDWGRLAADDRGNAEAVFVAGYGSHLFYDLVWFHKIVSVFVLGDWGDRMQRFVAHNTLLTFEDQHSLPKIASGTGEQILDVDAAGWLPFDTDHQLKPWQTLVGRQLLPDAEIETFKIFSRRMGLTPEQLMARLNDPDWMAENIFNYVPHSLIADVKERSLIGSIELVQDYLAPLLG